VVHEGGVVQDGPKKALFAYSKKKQLHREPKPLEQTMTDRADTRSDGRSRPRICFFASYKNRERHRRRWVAITGWWGKDRGGKCPFHGRSLDFWVFWSLGCVIADIYISICSCFPSRLQTTKNIKEMYGICFYFLFFRIPHLFVLSKTKEVVIDERIKLF